MPHQCVRCSTMYEDGSAEILKGCSCGGKLFFYIKKERLEKDKEIILSRQASPKVYDMNGSIFIYKRRFFELGKKTSISEKTMAYVMSHICFDINEPVDLLFIEFLIQNNLLGFEI